MIYGFAIAVVAVLVFGAAGAYLGHRLPIPAGVLLGTLVGVGAVSVGGVLLGLPQLPLPPGTRGVLQVMLGMMVGLRMSRESIREGVHALAPASLLAAVMISTAFVCALVAAPLTSVDLITALFAAAPGGLIEMSLMSMSFGADGAGVATVQFIRVVVALAAIDILLYWFRSKTKSEADPEGQEAEEEEQDDTPAKKTKYKEDLTNFAVAAPWGVIGGAIGLTSPVPAGGIIGALIGSVVFRLSTGREVPIEKFRILVQVLGGTVIGLEISSSFVSEVAKLAVAAALIIAIQMLIWLATSWLLVKLFRYGLSTSALASSPGGLSGVVPAADEAGADAVVVTFMHLVRLGAIVVTVPLLIALVFGY